MDSKSRSGSREPEKYDLKPYGTFRKPDLYTYTTPEEEQMRIAMR